MMQETAQQYIHRILGHIEGKDPLQVQQSTPRKLAALTKLLDRRRSLERPAPGKWSVTEILSHLADAELVIAWRLRSILSNNGTAIQAYDQDAWATTFNYRRRNPAVSLETFRVLRESNLALLKTVSKNLWDNYGVHQERGKETVAHLVRLVAGHDLNHLSQVEKIVKSRATKSKRSRKAKS